MPLSIQEPKTCLATGFQLFNQPNDLTTLVYWHSNQTPSPERNYVGNNYSRNTDPELDGLLDQYFITIPKGERADVPPLRQPGRRFVAGSAVGLEKLSGCLAGRIVLRSRGPGPKTGRDREKSSK